MTDLELTQACAEAMGWKHLGAVGVEPPKRGGEDPSGLWCLSGGNDWWINPEGHHVCAPCSGIPDPLHDKTQCFELIERFDLYISKQTTTDWVVIYPFGPRIQSSDLCRAIVECVASKWPGSTS